MVRKVCSVLAALALARSAAGAPEEKPKTKIREGAGIALEQLLGDHRLRIQWIDYDDKGEHRGKAVAEMNAGLIHLNGEQRGPRDNFVTVDGDILELTAITFRMRGKIVSRVDHLNGGAPCERVGEFSFAVYGGRPYWRLQQLQSPCGSHVDYVDLFLRPKPKAAPAKKEPSAARRRKR